MEEKSFSELDELLVDLYMKGEIEGAHKVGKMIVEKTHKDPFFNLDIMEHIDRMKYNLEFLSSFKNPKEDKEEVGTGKKVAILARQASALGEWDPRMLASGIPGSEEAIIYVANELVKRGYIVTIYANPGESSPWSLPLNNPLYLSESLWGLSESKKVSSSNLEKKEGEGGTKDGTSTKFDFVIMWRRTDFHVGRKRGNKVLYWPHDILGSSFDTKGLDGVFFLSKYQMDQHLEVVPALKSVKYVMAGNGIEPSQFKSPNKASNPYSCAYISNYARGLTILLDIWTDIKKAFPKATLNIYYGRQTFGSMGEGELKDILTKLEKLKQFGVTERGKVGHTELATALIRTSILTYPCISNAETYCISVVKAQAAGCIPVCSRIGALNETLHPDSPSVPKIEGGEGKEAYRKILMETMLKVGSDPKGIELEREKYMKFGQEKTWSKVVDQWESLFKEL